MAFQVIVFTGGQMRGVAVTPLSGGNLKYAKCVTYMGV